MWVSPVLSCLAPRIHVDIGLSGGGGKVWSRSLHTCEAFDLIFEAEMELFEFLVAESPPTLPSNNAFLYGCSNRHRPLSHRRHFQSPSSPRSILYRNRRSASNTESDCCTDRYTVMQCSGDRKVDGGYYWITVGCENVCKGFCGDVSCCANDAGTDCDDS
jgi:hypothetical protein